jgi:hypothetical protein
MHFCALSSFRPVVCLSHAMSAPHDKDVWAQTTYSLVATPAEKGHMQKVMIYMLQLLFHVWPNLGQICNKQSTFLTSEQGVMAKLEEVAQAVLWLRENCTRPLEFSTNITFHTQLGGMFLVYILMYSSI